MDSEIAFEENLNGLKTILDLIVRAHVFAISKGYANQLLSSQKQEWTEFYSILRAKNLPFLLEFVKDGLLENYQLDCQTLKEIFRDELSASMLFEK